MTDEGCHGAVAAATDGILAYPACRRIGPHLDISCAFILVLTEDEDARGLGLEVVALHRLQRGAVLQDCFCAGQLRHDPASAYINQAGCELTHDRGPQARFQAVDLCFIQRRDLGIGQLEGDLLVAGGVGRDIEPDQACATLLDQQTVVGADEACLDERMGGSDGRVACERKLGAGSEMRTR